MVRWQTLAAALAAAVTVVCVAPARARAGAAPEAAEPALYPVQVAVSIDGVPHGEHIVYAGGYASSARIWVPAALLCEARLCARGGELRGGVRYVNLSVVGAARARLDEGAGTLRIELRSENLPDTDIALGARAPANLERLSAPSLFVNYALTGSALLGEGAEFEPSGFGEAGLALRGALAYSSVSATTATGAVRGLSNLSLDRPRSLLRLSAGDEVVVGGALGGGGVLGGLHVTRDFSLDPYFVSQPMLLQRAIATAPSTVEVYRDGQLIRRETVPAGPFQLRELAGAGDTQVVIRDPFGSRTVAVPALVPPASALRPGLMQFSYSLGFARQRLAEASFDYGDPALLAVHRRGMTRHLTLGGRVEATPDRASAGASLTASLGRFSIEGTAAASVAADVEGGAGTAGDSMSGAPGGVSSAAALDAGWRGQRTTAAVQLRAVGARYATIDLGPGDDRALYEAGAGVSWSPTRRGSIGAQVGAEQRSLTGSRGRASLLGGLRLGEVYLSATIGGTATSEERTFDATVVLTRLLGKRASGSVGAGHGSGGAALTAGLSRPVAGFQGLGLDAGVRTSEETNAGHARGVYEHGYGRAGASFEWFGAGGRAAVELAGGIVVLGGRVKATRPVQGSFALVRVPGAPGAPVYLDNHLVGTTDARGDLVLPSLQPYYGSRVRLDASRLPLEIETPTLERVIAPPRRGGAIVAFGRGGTSAVLGAVAAQLDGAPFDVSFGELVVAGAGRVPIGRDGAFEVEALAPGRHRATIDVDGMSCALELSVPVGGPMVQVGTLGCRLVRAARAGL